MGQMPVPRWVSRVLVAGALVLPITICVIWAVSLLLGEMDDPVGERVLKYVALAAGILLTVNLICLVLIQGLNSLDETDESE